MSGRTSMLLTDEDRALEDRVRAACGDALPDERYRTAMYRMALQNLLDTIENHREFDGDPRVAKQFRTKVVRPKYRTHVDVKRP